MSHLWKCSAFLKEKCVTVTLFGEFLNAMQQSVLFLENTSVQLKPESCLKPVGHTCRSLNSFFNSPSQMSAMCRCRG